MSDEVNNKESGAEQTATVDQAEDKAARPNVKAAKPDNAAEAAPKEPSPNQPLLDQMVQLIKENVSEEAIEQAYINEMDRHLPCIVVKSEYWLSTAQWLYDNDEHKLDYLRNVTGVDLEKHLEVVYHLYSFRMNNNYCFKVKTDREHPSIPSVTPVWAAANWNEREIYDLFGIDFPGHPDLRRIMMPDDWVGYPLRKDYEPADPEV